MSPRFEQTDRPRKAPKGREDIHEARWQTRGNRPTTDEDVDADVSMSEIFNDKKQYVEYKKVGFHQYGQVFLQMTDEWEKKSDDPTKRPLTEAQRDMREDVRSEFTTRLGILKSCEKLLTKDVFKGVGDAHEGVNRVVGELGDARALELVKSRLLNLVGEEDGTESLTELWGALREMHGVYKTSGFSKVQSRIERYRAQYGITPAKWAEIQAGGSWWNTGKRAYGEFQKQHGFLGRQWNKLSHMWHGAKVGFAGWREDKNSQMQRLRETRSQALEVLSRVLGEDVQQLVDEEIKHGKPEETDRTLRERGEKDEELSRGSTVEDITRVHDYEWEQYVNGNPSENNTRGYDQWRVNTFKSNYERRLAASGGSGLIVRMMRALFGMQMNQMQRPAGI